MAKLPFSIRLRLGWHLLSWWASMPLVWVSTSIKARRISSAQALKIQAIHDDDHLWGDIHPSSYQASLDNEDLEALDDLWHAYLDSPHCVRTNRAYLNQCFNLESHVK